MSTISHRYSFKPVCLRSGPIQGTQKVEYFDHWNILIFCPAVHWDTPIPPLSVNIFFYFLTKPVVGWAPPQVEIFHTQKSFTKNGKQTKWWFLSPEYWVPSPHRNWHKPSDREFILNWVCPAEIDHITLSLLMKASLESLSDILYCYLFQFLVARECGPSDTLSSATDGKGAKKARWQNSPSLPAKQLALPNQEL